MPAILQGRARRGGKRSTNQREPCARDPQCLYEQAGKPRGSSSAGRRRDRRVADARLVVFAVGALPWPCLILPRAASSPWWLAVPAAVFVALALSHEPIRRAGDRARRAVDFYSKGLARLEGRWAGPGVTGLEFLDLEHPYAADLDLFGEGSLFERLCTARTRAGEETLARWLLAPADPARSGSGTRRSCELRPRLDLREDLELLGVEIRAAIDPAALAALGHEPSGVSRQDGSCSSRPSWACSAPRPSSAGRSSNTGLFPLLAVIAGRRHVRPACSPGGCAAVLAAVDRRTHDLVLLSELLRRLEREPFQAPLLRRLVKVARDRWTARLEADPPAGPAAAACSTTSGTSSSCRWRSSGSGRSSSPCGSTPGGAGSGRRIGRLARGDRRVRGPLCAWRRTPPRTRPTRFPSWPRAPHASRPKRSATR